MAWYVVPRFLKLGAERERKLLLTEEKSPKLRIMSLISIRHV